MPRFPDYIIHEIVEKNDIYDIVSQSVHLKKSGNSYIGLCPFHNEKTPSFSVSQRKGIFKCFGCGEGGDVVRFVMKSDDVSFADAVKKLADRANIALPEVKSGDRRKEEYIKERNSLMYSINKAAAEFFFSCIKNSDEAVAYFKKRELDSKTVKYFWLGYSPDSWTGLFEHLKSLGYSEGDIFDAGLVKQHDSGRYYDTFRNRIMFTIFDTNNNIIGFGGRVLDDSKPKYLNSSDSYIFNKSKNLYALNIARHSKKPFVILAEGYMDAIALIKSGYDNTVATLGTALTDYQAKILSRYYKEIVICYDSDNAGRNATNRAISILRAYDIKISVLNLKGGKDPDEYIKTFGRARFDDALSKRKTDMVYLIDYFGEKYDLKKSDDVISYISELTDYLKLIKSSVELDVYTGMISSKTGVQPASISSQLGLKKAAGSGNASIGNAEVINVVNKSGQPSDDSQYLEKTCSLLLSTLFYDMKLFNKHKERINEDMFENDIQKKLYRYIKHCSENTIPVSGTALLNEFESEEDINALTGILALDIQSDDTELAVNDYIKQINENGAVQRAFKLFKENKITLEEFNSIINNKG